MSFSTMRCPTCRAVQEWSDACRRCKCDFRLLREVVDEYSVWRRRCLRSLRENRIRPALEQARRCVALRADFDSRRLLAVCEFLNENWPAALSQAEELLADSEPRDEG